MKKCWALLLVCFLLSGCSDGDRALERGLEVRKKLLCASECSFLVTVTADYGEELHSFQMENTVDGTGNLQFTVTGPDSIAGITGSVSSEGGKLTFDETALFFPLLTSQRLSPVSAPWILMKTLRSGYLTSGCMEEELLRLTIDDSYWENAMTVDVWLDAKDCPVQAEISWEGRKILSLSIEHFEIR